MTGAWLGFGDLKDMRGEDGATVHSLRVSPDLECTVAPGRAEQDRGRQRLAGHPAGQSRGIRVVRGVGKPAIVAWAGLGLSTILWLAALRRTNIAPLKTAPFGLILVLPGIFWAAVGVLMLSFSVAVVRRATHWTIMAAYLTVLVMILHATPAILYGTLRYSWAWKHIGVVDFIAHNGIVFNLQGILGAYQGWPGFFALNSFLTTAAGQHSALSYAPWVLVVNDLLYLGPVVLIAGAFTSDRRLIWTAAWLFEIGNWVGQDYYSPQGFAFFLYLTVIAVCLRWAVEPSRTPDTLDLATTNPANLEDILPVARPERLSQPARLVLAVCLLPLMAAIASSHQLTPIVLILALTTLFVFRHLRSAVLPLTMALITVCWDIYGGMPWIIANRSTVFAGFGLPWANASQHVVGGTQVPFDQLIVKWGIRWISAAIVALAIIGYFRYRRYHDNPDRRSWNRAALLAVGVVAVVALDSYGGEIIFRAFLFALPFLAVCAAAAFFPHPQAGRPAWTGLGLAVAVLALVPGFALGNYGQEDVNYFNQREIAAAQWLYQNAPEHTNVLAANSNFPWAFAHYNRFTYDFLATPPDSTSPGAGERRLLRNPVTIIARDMEPKRGAPPSYLILTSGQGEMEYDMGAWPKDALSHITRELLASGKFRVVYRNADALILQLSPAHGARQTGAAR